MDRILPRYPPPPGRPMNLHVVTVSDRVAVAVDYRFRIVLAVPDGYAEVDPDALAEAVAECEAWRDQATGPARLGAVQ